MINSNHKLTTRSLILQSRAALSLLGYCYYQMQDFVNAADCYEQLTALNPEVEDYRYGRLNHSTTYKTINMIIVVSKIVGNV